MCAHKGATTIQHNRVTLSCFQAYHGTQPAIVSVRALVILMCQRRAGGQRSGRRAGGADTALDTPALSGMQCSPMKERTAEPTAMQRTGSGGGGGRMCGTYLKLPRNAMLAGKGEDGSANNGAEDEDQEAAEAC